MPPKEDMSFLSHLGVKKILAMWQRLKGFVPTYNNITIGNYIDCFGIIEKDWYASQHVNIWIIERGIVHGI